MADGDGVSENERRGAQRVPAHPLIRVEIVPCLFAGRVWPLLVGHFVAVCRPEPKEWCPPFPGRFRAPISGTVPTRVPALLVELGSAPVIAIVGGSFARLLS